MTGNDGARNVKKVFRAVTGGRTAPKISTGQRHNAVLEAKTQGFHVGRRVRIGTVPGVVIGYNIGGRGKFHGATYPLVVQTRFGIAKCSLAEIHLA